MDKIDINELQERVSKLEDAINIIAKDMDEIKSTLLKLEKINKQFQSSADVFNKLLNELKNVHFK